jgi:HEAT repeat protein
VRDGRRFFRFSVVAAVLVLAGAIVANGDRILERWYVYRLDSANVEVRKHAVERLWELGSRRAGPRLAEIAWTDDAVGPRAVAALLRWSDETPPELLSLLRWKSRDYLRRTVAAIERDASSPASGSLLLEIALHGPDGLGTDEFGHVVEALESAGWDAVPGLIRALESGDRVVRERAFRLLRPADLRAVPVLCSLLEREEWARHAGEALASLGPGVLPALATVLEGEHEQGRRGAAMATAGMGDEAAPLVPALVRTLEDPRPEVRAEVVRALGSLGKIASASVPALLEALADPASRAVHRRMGPDTPADLPECREVRCAVVSALGRTAGGETAAVDALAALVTDDNACLARRAVIALGEMRGSRAIPALTSALDHSRAEVRAEAARALGHIGSDARETVPGLIEALRDPSFDAGGTRPMNPFAPSAGGGGDE